MSTLADTQRRLWRLLTAPSGVGTALAEAGDPSGASLDGWLVSDPRVPARVRLEIYANAYFQRIHDALARDFGALAANLGAEGFHDLVTAYLCVHPPERPSLRHAGERLAAFLDAHPAAAPFRRRWPFAADLARLETALADAFDAPDEPPLRREALAAVAPEAWPRLGLRLQRGARVIELAAAACALRERFEADAPDASPEARAGRVTALVWRRRERAHFREIGDEEAELLRLAQLGAPFAELCDRLAARCGAEAAPARAASWLATWTDAELLVGEAPPRG